MFAITRQIFNFPVTFPATLSVIFYAMGSAVLSFSLESAVDHFGWHRGHFAEAPWRLVTAHFVHLNGAHFAVNWIAAVLVGWVCDLFKLSRELLMASAISLVVVCLGLEFGPWHIDWYVGFSGVLHGVFAWFCLCLWGNNVHWPWLGARGMVAALFLGALGKVLISLSIPVGSLGWQGIPQATPVHLYGFTGGVFWALLRRPR